MSPLNQRDDGGAAGGGYWRSLAQLADTPEYRQQAGQTDKALEEAGDSEMAELQARLGADGLSRRRFLQLTGASAALAGLAGCREPVDKVLPFSGAGASHVPGTSTPYATAYELGGHAIGLLVGSYDGRPIKAEGNPRHPISAGAQSSFAISSVLELYDPDRSRGHVRRDGAGYAGKSWNQFLEYAGPLFGRHAEGKGAGLRVLSEAVGSPTLRRLKAEFAKAFPSSEWIEYEPLESGNVAAGSVLAFGKPLRSHYQLDKAEIVLLLDADILEGHAASLKHSRDFAKGRKVVDGKMSRVYAVESVHSLTGSNADHRLPVRSELVGAYAAALAERLAGKLPGCPKVSWSPVSAATGTDLDGTFLDALAGDLLAGKGRAVVVVGERQPAAVHALGHWLNQALGAFGVTVAFTPETDPARDASGLVKLVADAKAGKVDTLLILGGNPVYNAPADLDFAGALAKVRDSIHVSLYRDETSRLATWHVARSHYLESWGDARAWEGTISLIQPLINPLHPATKSPVEVLGAILALAGAGPELDAVEHVRRTLATLLRRNVEFESAWRHTLHDGMLAGSGAFAKAPPAGTAYPAADGLAPKVEIPAFKGDLGGATFLPSLPSGGPGSLAGSDLEVVFTPDLKVHDGRFTNLGWQVELPDPVTKLVWDNGVIISPATAAALKLDNDDIVKVRFDGRSVEGPVYILPGQADGSVTLNLGWGRTAAGRIGGVQGSDVPADQSAPTIGFDFYKLRTSTALHFARGAELVRTGRKYVLVSTQDHHAIDAIGAGGQAKRLPEIVREADLERFRKNPNFAEELLRHPPIRSLWDDKPYDDPKYNPTQRKWGMAVDLNACTGCGACVVACQSENNIPTVGKDAVARGREMHWIRIDRYFKGTTAAPQVAHQVVTCQHCENAPCEQVCPVNATVHNNEGLNVMVYNRCVGTRYCSNNCPYKVRRYNWFYLHKRLEQPGGETLKLSFNPEVTVRSRGVMEKCTMCNHRIWHAGIKQRNGGFGAEGANRIPDGSLQVACQQACAAGAIVFGDLADKGSAVSKAFEDSRRYALLEEFNTKPRLQYIAKVRNPHPLLAPKHSHGHGHDHDDGHDHGKPGEAKKDDKPHARAVIRLPLVGA